MSNRWLELMEADYIEQFIADGGSTVKFALSPSPLSRKEISEELCSLANRHNFLHFALHASRTRLHLIHAVFYEIARQLNWDHVVTERLKKHFREIGISRIPDLPPFNLSEIAEANGIDRRALAEGLQARLRNQLCDDDAMTQEFKTAVLHLCLAQIQGPEGPLSSHRSAVLAWLTGNVTHLTEIKAAGIYQKVTRSNARHLLSSIGHFIRLGGYSGTMLVLDIARYFDYTHYMSRDAGYYYTSANAVDCYELLRQLVDEQEVLEGMFIVVLAPYEFISDTWRGLERYQALKMRLVDDVRVRSRQNLLAPLVYV